MGGGRREPYYFPSLAPSRGAVPGSVRGSVRPLRPLMLAASPEVLDPKIPFLCTQRGYIHVLDIGGGRVAAVGRIYFVMKPPPETLFQALFGRVWLLNVNWRARAFPFKERYN